MRRFAFGLVSLFALSSSLLASCAADAPARSPGQCTDPSNGRTLVRLDAQLMYAGQAVMLASCATGCHSSRASGQARLDAPRGLDFDLAPVPPGNAITDVQGNVTSVLVNNVDIAQLRQRQNSAYDARARIWGQVVAGAMPPQESFERAVSGIKRITFGADGLCSEGASLGSFDEAKEELRKWLACGMPLVETTSVNLPFVAPPESADAAERSAGATSYAGTVGYQLPACGRPGSDALTFDNVYTRVFLPASCTSCHTPAARISELDLSTSGLAYTALLGADGQGAASSCADNERPLVSPSDPAGSYLIAKLGGSEAGMRCGDPMPLGAPTGLSINDLELVRRWIAEGARP